MSTDAHQAGSPHRAIDPPRSRVAGGVALIVLVTAEFAGARSGIGVLIFVSWQVFAIERPFVGLVVVSFLGYVLSLLI